MFELVVAFLPDTTGSSPPGPGTPRTRIHFSGVPRLEISNFSKYGVGR